MAVRPAPRLPPRRPEPASARHQSPAAARGAPHKAAGGGVKRKGSPAAAAASAAAKRSSPGPDPARRPAAAASSQASLRGTSPLANGSQAAAAAAAGKGTSKAAARPATPAPARAGSGALGRPAPAAAAAAPVLSRGAAAGEPVGGFGAGQWHGLREGQIVWAKMAGFPHWPAQVCRPCLKWRHSHFAICCLAGRCMHFVWRLFLLRVPDVLVLALASAACFYAIEVLTWVVRRMPTGAGAHAFCTAGAGAWHAAPRLRGVLWDRRLPGGYPAMIDMFTGTVPSR